MVEEDITVPIRCMMQVTLSSSIPSCFIDFGMYSYGHLGGNWSYNKMHGKSDQKELLASLIRVYACSNMFHEHQHITCFMNINTYNMFHEHQQITWSTGSILMTTATTLPSSETMFGAMVRHVCCGIL